MTVEGARGRMLRSRGRTGAMSQAATQEARLRRRERGRSLTGMSFMLPWFVGFVIFTAYPLVATIGFSFTDFSLFTFPHWVGVSNYTRLVHDPTFLLASRNTAAFTVAIVPFSIVIALGLAVLLNGVGRGSVVHRSIIFAPSVLPTAAVATVWIWILSPQFGLLNSGLRALGLPQPPWLSSPHWAMWAVVISTLWLIGSDMLLYLAALQGIPTDQYDAAKIDGANTPRLLWYVTIPNLTPIIYLQLINALIFAVQNFSIPYIMGGSGGGAPGGSLTYYGIYLYQNAFGYLRMGYASAMAVVLFVVVLALTLLLVRSSSRWVSYDRY